MNTEYRNTDKLFELTDVLLDMVVKIDAEFAQETRLLVNEERAEALRLRDLNSKLITQLSTSKRDLAQKLARSRVMLETSRGKVQRLRATLDGKEQLIDEKNSLLASSERELSALQSHVVVLEKQLREERQFADNLGTNLSKGEDRLDEVESEKNSALERLRAASETAYELQKKLEDMQISEDSELADLRREHEELKKSVETDRLLTEEIEAMQRENTRVQRENSDLKQSVMNAAARISTLESKLGTLRSELGMGHGGYVSLAKRNEENFPPLGAMEAPPPAPPVSPKPFEERTWRERPDLSPAPSFTLPPWGDAGRSIKAFQRLHAAADTYVRKMLSTHDNDVSRALSIEGERAILFSRLDACVNTVSGLSGKNLYRQLYEKVKRFRDQFIKFFNAGSSIYHGYASTAAEREALKDVVLQLNANGETSRDSFPA